MTRDELIQLLKDHAKDHRDAPFPAGEMIAIGRHAGAAVAYQHASELAEQLDFPPAMTWQDEPSGPGVYFIEGGLGVEPERVPQELTLKFDYSKHKMTWQTRWGWSLNDRRVCPIPAPPALPKRGDA